MANNFEMFYQTYQPLIYSVAYRLLGTVTDAEDAVQDIFLKSEQIDKSTIQNMKAFLIKMTTNHCLNLMQTAAKKREIYIGEWLPEPEVDLSIQNPLDEIVQKEDVSYAFLVLMEQLNPVERTVFVLRETMNFDYSEISEILDKSEANCRKIYSRSKEKLNQDVSVQPQRTEQAEEMIASFISGTKSGNFKPFINLLTEDAVLLSDGGGKVRAAIFPILGKHRILAFLEGIASKGSSEYELEPALVNGEAGLLVKKNEKSERVICFEWDQNRKMIRSVYMVVNPDKLKHI